MASDEIYLENRSLIDRAIGALCRRQRLFSVDAEDFAGSVRLRLLEDDCAILRRFEGRSALTTYLSAVVTHLYQDWRNAQWGKWRPSVEAKRGGALAVVLERLIVRDGLTMEEAYETLRTNYQLGESRADIEALAARFPPRSPRQFVSEESLANLAARDGDPDAQLAGRQTEAAALAASRTLSEALRALPPQDRLILRLRFQDGFAIADISRTLGLDQKPLYRRLERLLAGLRADIERTGLTAAAAVEILEQGGFHRLEEDAVRWETRDGGRPLDRGEDAPVQSTRMP